MNFRTNANAIVTNSEGKILLIKLKSGPFAGGLCIPGGGIEPGEMGEAAARREVLEETGITLSEKITPIGFCELTDKASQNHRVVLIFHTTAEGIPSDTEEGIAGWFNIDDAKKSSIAFTREALRIWQSGEKHFIVNE